MGNLNATTAPEHDKQALPTLILLYSSVIVGCFVLFTSIAPHMVATAWLILSVGLTCVSADFAYTRWNAENSRLSSKLNHAALGLGGLVCGITQIGIFIFLLYLKFQFTQIVDLLFV